MIISFLGIQLKFKWSINFQSKGRIKIYISSCRWSAMTKWSDVSYSTLCVISSMRSYRYARYTVWLRSNYPVKINNYRSLLYSKKIVLTSSNVLFFFMQLRKVYNISNCSMIYGQEKEDGSKNNYDIVMMMDTEVDECYDNANM